jgi:hypothetical protein
VIPTRRPKPRVRVKGKGTARAQLAARDPKRGVTPLGGGSMGFLTQRQYKAAKKVWPG